MAEIGDNIGAAELRQFIERVERLEEEIRELSLDKSEVFKEARGRGFNVRAIKALIAERRREPHELEEEQAMVELYREALDRGKADALSEEIARRTATKRGEDVL